MKLIHISDLHLGKRIFECSMLEDQESILNSILHLIDAEQPDGVILAGAISDKPIPPAEAVQLFDAFLVQLAKRKLEVDVISGNHYIRYKTRQFISVRIVSANAKRHISSVVKAFVPWRDALGLPQTLRACRIFCQRLMEIVFCLLKGIKNFGITVGGHYHTVILLHHIYFHMLRMDASPVDHIIAEGDVPIGKGCKFSQKR